MDSIKKPTNTVLAAARRLINEENAFETVTRLSRQIRDLTFSLATARSNGGAPDADVQHRLTLIRLARAAAFDVYEELFGTDELDDTLELCDLILIGEAY